MTELHPPIEPYEQGLLDTGDGNLLYWETCGNPAGKPALVVHGGPGSGCSVRARRYFDPARYRVILFDQRNCGRSTPHAGDPATDLSRNTTPLLISDMEQLREHLGIEQWLLYGGSWGSTLILAYAEAHPQRVSEIVIGGVTMTRRSEIAWLYGGVGRFFPEALARFRAGAPESGDDAGLVPAYARRASDPDPEVRAKAVADWCEWEDAVLSLEPHGSARPFSDRPSAARVALVRIASHYFSHGAWLAEGALLRDAHRLKGIPGALFHGRHDLSSPYTTAWELAQAWPEAELTVIEDAGHKGSATLRDAELRVLDRFGSSGSRPV
ncbi:prolyl aminopeptidase [Streptomyces sp. NPDC051320]|uniref:prolyl aminopeptidase n=1 Tax=Streptomyces sp. NPDC051320 TaxID=3154644 RepID=UPI0034204A3F